MRRTARILLRHRCDSWLGSAAAHGGEGPPSAASYGAAAPRSLDWQCGRAPTVHRLSVGDHDPSAGDRGFDVHVQAETRRRARGGGFESPYEQASSAEHATAERSRSAGAAKSGQQTCPSCSKACCHASAPPPSAALASEPIAFTESASWVGWAGPSWFEPVPRKPPRLRAHLAAASPLRSRALARPAPPRERGVPKS